MTALPVAPSFAFLSAGALISPQALAGAFNTAVSATEPDTAGIADDLDRFVSAAGGVFGMGPRLRGFARSIDRPPGTGLGPFALWQDVEEVLAGIPQPVLDRVKGRLFLPDGSAGQPGAPSGAGRAVVSYVQPDLVISVDGVPVEPPAEDVSVFPIVSPPQRTPVSNPEEQRSAAIDNMRKAIACMGGAFLADHTTMLLPHLEAIISGEIDAPEDVRTSVVEFVAGSAAHAEAYGMRVLQDAVMVDKLKPPLPVIPHLAELSVRPKPWAPEKTAEVPRAQRALFSLDDLFSGYRALDQLLNSADPAVRGAIEKLGELNPSAFSREAIARLINAAALAGNARRIESPLDRAAYLYDGCLAGMIPGDCIARKEKNTLKFDRPSTGGSAAPLEWSDPAGQFIQGPAFASAVAETALEDTTTRTFSSLSDLIRSHPGYAPRFAKIRDLLNAGDFDGARQAVVRARTKFLADDNVMLNEFDLHQMDSLAEKVEPYIAAGSLAEAEAVLDFAEEWMHPVRGAIGIIAEHNEMLMKAGETAAAEELLVIAREHLRVGNMDALDALKIYVSRALLNMEAAIKVSEGKLFARIHAALVMILEAARSLGALPEGEASGLLAQRVPSVPHLLSSGPTREEVARAYLGRIGIPVPGDPGVLALGTLGITGLALLPEGKVAGLLPEPEAKPEATE